MNVYRMNLQLCDAFMLICPKISVEGSEGKDVMKRPVSVCVFVSPLLSKWPQSHVSMQLFSIN